MNSPHFPLSLSLFMLTSTHTPTPSPTHGVLLDGHDLDGVIAELADAREHVLFELEVRVDLRLCGGHAHVALVDAQGVGPVGEEGVGESEREMKRSV
jgi:hypothetical protein